MSRRPHILYTTPIFGYPALGGPRLRTDTTLKALARCADVSLYLTQPPDTADYAAARAHLLGFCREVFFPPPPRRPSLPRRIGRAAVPARVRSALRNALRVRADHEQQAPPAVAPEPQRNLELIARLRDWIKTHRPDLIWLGFGGISYDLLPLRQLTDTPLVLETECVWSRFVLRELPFEADPLRREQILRAGQAKAAEERSGAALADLTTAVSDVDAEYFRSLAPDSDRVMLLANVIDVQAYAQPAAAVRLEQPAVVFTGTLSYGTANVDAALWLVDEVMELVWRRRPDVHLYVVGRSPAPPILARRGPRVHVTGEVPSIVPYMHASTAALVPLRWESGTRFKILEAFACCTPVISTTLGAEGLSVQHGRHLLLADEPPAFAAAILSLVEDRALRERLIGPAYDLVRGEYDLTSAERQIRAILARLGFAVVAAS